MDAIQGRGPNGEMGGSTILQHNHITPTLFSHLCYKMGEERGEGREEGRKGGRVEGREE